MTNLGKHIVKIENTFLKARYHAEILRREIKNRRGQATPQQISEIANLDQTITKARKQMRYLYALEQLLEGTGIDIEKR